MRLRSDFIALHDLDWFAVVSGVPVHVSTAGGVLPDFIREKEVFYRAFRTAMEMGNQYAEEDIFVNQQFIEDKIKRQNEGLGEFLAGGEHLKNSDYEEMSLNEQVGRYSKFFVAMAQKGFVSFDRSNLTNPNDNNYHLVACPAKGVLPELAGGALPNVECKQLEIFNQELDKNLLKRLVEQHNFLNGFDLIKDFRLYGAMQ